MTFTIVKCREPANQSEERVYNNGYILVMKKNIAGIDKYWIDEQRIWRVSIIVSGFAYDLKCYFKKETQAQECFDIIQEWLIYEA